MTAQCANPACSIPLRFLNAGRLFQFEIRPKPVEREIEPNPAEPSALASQKIQHFWLCGQCASRLTLVFDALRGVVIAPRI